MAATSQLRELKKLIGSLGITNPDGSKPKGWTEKEGECFGEAVVWVDRPFTDGEVKGLKATNKYIQILVRETFTIVTY
tara:strand:- start:5378 stop:5611 length:234 start_codon:yes stop_codon:yes gene_type:complete